MMAEVGFYFELLMFIYFMKMIKLDPQVKTINVILKCKKGLKDDL